jgi:hypothetical protein
MHRVGVKDHLEPAGIHFYYFYSVAPRRGGLITNACIVLSALGPAGGGCEVEGEELPKAKEAEPELYTVTCITSVALRRGYTISNIDEAYMVRQFCQLLQRVWP